MLLLALLGDLWTTRAAPLPPGCRRNPAAHAVRTAQPLRGPGEQLRSRAVVTETVA